MKERMSLSVAISLSPRSPPTSPSRRTFPSLEVAGLTSFPPELHLNILTYLRATDLSALQRTSCCFNNRVLINAVVDHAANEVYGSDLTKGFDSPIVAGEVKSVAVVSKKSNQLESSNASCADEVSASIPVYTYEMLRNMEMLVVARVLSRPEPPIHERDTCFYVSKSWCRAALRWLEVQEEERKERIERQRAAEEARSAAAAALASPKGGKMKNTRHPGSSGKKKKLSKKELKEQRQRERRHSDAMPPWSNINDDIVCEHGDLKQCSGKSARARRRTMDKQAWKVLKRLYPDSVQLEASIGKSGCLLCAAELETAKKAEADKKEEEKAERKKPLACPIVRAFYSRGNKGYPLSSLAPPRTIPCLSGFGGNVEEGLSTFAPIPLENGNHCPLKPGVYCALPRSWCHRWRKYIKTGEGGLPPAPDGSEMLCDAHNLPLVPPHLESFLQGETSSLLGGASTICTTPHSNSLVYEEVSASAASFNSPLVSDAETLQALRAAGLSEQEVHAQRLAMMGMEEERNRLQVAQVQRERSGSEVDRMTTNEQLDRENRVVVEILTDEEVSALEKWWPHVHGTYGIRFAVVESSSLNCLTAESEIIWHTLPCRECDPSSRADATFTVRSRLQKRGYR